MAGKELLEQGGKRRVAILKFLQKYITKNGWAPTIQEICDAVGLVSPNATRNHLRKLEELGFITMEPRVARAISLTKPQPDIKLLTTIKPTRKKRAVAVVSAPVVVAEEAAAPAPVKKAAPRRRQEKEKVPA
jgi:SOS-response transcriptional repressor LexA